MNISQIVKKILKETPLPPYEIELMLAHTLKKSREFLLTHPEYQLTKTQIAKFKTLLARRKKGEPIAYLTGHKEFYGLDFIVNKNVLIPRPETELMVDEALNRIARISYRASHNETRNTKSDMRYEIRDTRYTIIDVGTGSGCIIITLAKILNQKSKTCLPVGKVENLKFFATDISGLALHVAKQNAKLHKVQNKIKFLHGNLLEPLIRDTRYAIRDTRFIILANLPYLTPAQIKKSPTIKYEPKLALAAGQDGLKYYRQLFKQIKILNKMRYAIRDARCVILCEIDPSQKNKIKQLIHKELPKARIEIKKDLRGHNRLVIINLSSCAKR